MNEKPRLGPILTEAMRTHDGLLSILMSLKEEHINAMLEYELADNRPRASVITRLHQRRGILRGKRELAEMLDGLVSARGRK